DAVGEVDPSRHESALTAMGFLFAQMISTDDVIAAFETRAVA
ncbi:unnamed protein product, partial [Laminaria digitata]